MHHCLKLIYASEFTLFLPRYQKIYIVINTAQNRVKRQRNIGQVERFIIPALCDDSERSIHILVC